jgi:S1-C subfamily serine protease
VPEPVWDDRRIVSALDLLILAAVVLAAVSGHRRGFSLQLLTYGGLLLGVLVGSVLAPRLAPLVDSALARSMVALASLVGAATIGEGLGWMAGSALRTRARRTRLSRLDAGGGSVVAVAAVLLTVWIVGVNLVNGPSPLLARQISGSAVVRTLGAVLPPPPPVFTEVGRFLDRFGFPQVFAGLPPAPAGPVQAPSEAEARRAFEAAAASTVQVLGESCDRIQEGSGFVVDRGYVVTNAHVLAGVGSPQVRGRDGTLRAATVVHFDPELDVALLLVAEPVGPPLPIAVGGTERGDRGAILGYPGGGSLQGRAAAVRRPIEAVGPDIYGSGRVSRDVLELQAVVRPGNSGGPFVEVDGDVAGMVFAASTVDAGVGYALSASELRDVLGRALGRTGGVPTGPCIR